jgi:endonuclease/exonuclease/phosphatase family metal-dependent hydrolase
MHGPRPLFRIATYNVHSCVGPDGVHDPARIAGVISELDADVVALQEFSYPSDIALETRTPVVLTELDTYQCALGPTRRNPTHCFGNVILTRHHLREIHRVDLSVLNREPRGALAATIDVDGTELHVLAAHLGLRLSERRFQVRQIADYLESVRGTFVVVLGDFNDWLPGRSVVHTLDQRLGRAPRVRSFPVKCPVLSLDRVWVQPRSAMHRLFVHRSEAARLASDHYPVVADIELLADELSAGRASAVQQRPADQSPLTSRQMTPGIPVLPSTV